MPNETVSVSCPPKPIFATLERPDESDWEAYTTLPLPKSSDTTYRGIWSWLVLMKFLLDRHPHIVQGYKWEVISSVMDHGQETGMLAWSGME